ncbi:hypothetical protein SBI_07570 [Streptomyces bingchenggensis BCW-1]|uniref:Uncharacterized protein n=1 Tax=Streptomyces bingchenggensis (strain BCW-1) TaxID=749414 RepID=D7CB07_STRBB|nr:MULTISPECIES: DUF5984 family protein [Streptomyces]ADI10690.1 hypothetical protein SBI_07570 [Streptomyces bingchenggensis BCW-1]
MIRFRFGLTPLAEVRPWGRRERPVLHWFGLTDGWYAIDLGEHELLRYSERTVRRLRGDGGGPAHPYADYYVVRLWEDLLALLPAALEPVPEDLADFVACDSSDWCWEDTPEADSAAQWHGDRSLYTGYLRIAPDIRCWRTVAGEHDAMDDVMNVSWAHPSDPEGEIEFAGPATGRVTVPTSAFVAAVTELDRALLEAMERRIGELEAAGPPPGVELDLEQLRREHRDRAGWLERARRYAYATDWAAVRTGAAALLRSPGEDCG